ANDGHLERRLVLAGRLDWKPSNDLIQQVSGTQPVQRRQTQRLSQAELIELDGAEKLVLIVSLVGYEDHGFGGAPQPFGHVCVGLAHAGARIDHENDDVGLIHGLLGLLFDHGRKVVGVVGSDTARIDDRERSPRPFGLTVDAIARGTGHILDDGLTLADQAVEQRRLADVRPADDGYDRLHRSTPDGSAECAVLSVESLGSPAPFAACPRAWRPAPAYTPRSSSGRSVAMAVITTSVASERLQPRGTCRGSPTRTDTRQRERPTNTRSVPAMPTGSTSAPLRRASNATPLCPGSRPLPWLRCPSGNMPTAPPSARMRSACRMARRSSCSRSTGNAP